MKIKSSFADFFRQMNAKSIFIKFWCYLFTVLILGTVFVGNTSKIGVSEPKTEQQDQSEDSQYTQDNGLEAVVNVGIFVDFVKFIEIKGIFWEIIQIFTQKNSKSSPFVHLLSYFQNLYKSSILINAP